MSQESEVPKFHLFGSVTTSHIATTLSVLDEKGLEVFISKKVIYLELQKTGCTHIRNLLSEAIPGKLLGKHNSVTSDLVTKDRVLLGSIRNPWDWYCSLWAYGCDKRGKLYKDVTRPSYSPRDLGWKSTPFKAFRRYISPSSPDMWQDLYKDINDADAFRAWLRALFDPKYRHQVSDEFGLHPMSENVGLMTFRYLNLYCVAEENKNQLLDLYNLSHVMNFERENCLIDFFVRNENLEEDLLGVLKKSGIEIKESFKASLLSKDRTNTSSKRFGSSYYFDDETEALIATKDALIVKKFSYLAPSQME